MTAPQPFADLPTLVGHLRGELGRKKYILLTPTTAQVRRGCPWPSSEYLIGQFAAGSGKKAGEFCIMGEGRARCVQQLSRCRPQGVTIMTDPGESR
ncbi:MAG: hypothetical protein HQL57_06880 [Magnetococcales bacterium]|nr:hypothetical protein [Magnetococcales bacterium]MBF0156893.1 hypothetical protein [Magnetococcales bacterium]